MEYIPTKHNYQLIIADAEAKIKEQKDRILKVREFYIKANAEFSVGDIIRISTPKHPYWTFAGEKGIIPATSRLAFVVGYDISYEDDVKYLLKRCKKDGTMSKINDHYSITDVLTLYSNDH